MVWQIYLLISILLISCNALFHRSIMKDDASDSRAQTVAFLGLGGILAIVIASLQSKLNLFFPTFLLSNFLLLVALLVPGFLLSYQSYKLIGAGEVVLFLATGRLWNVIGAFFFLHETITLQIIIGALVIIIGALVIIIGITIARYEKRKFLVNQGVMLALLAAFFFGMSEIDGYYILRSMAAPNFLIYADLLPVISILLLFPVTCKKLRYYFTPQKGIKLLFLSLCDTLGTLALYLSYQTGGKASIIGPLSATRVLVTTILAIIILKERTNMTNKLIGAAITVLGVILLI